MPLQMLQGDKIHLMPPSMDRLDELQSVIDDFNDLHHSFLTQKRRTTKIQATKANLEHYIKNFLNNRTEYVFFVIENKCQNLVGWASIQPRNCEVNYFKIGYWIGTQFMRQGYATEACRLATRIALDVFKANRLELEIASTNGASQTVAKRNGYELEAVLRASCVGLGGKPDAGYIYTYPHVNTMV